MVERPSNGSSQLDCMSNIYNAIAVLKADAVACDSDVILSLMHAAEGLPQYAEAGLLDGAFDAKTEAFVRIGCLADLIDKVNLDVDDQLLHAASALLHLANQQLELPQPA